MVSSSPEYKAHLLQDSKTWQRGEVIPSVIICFSRGALRFMSSLGKTQMELEMQASSVSLRHRSDKVKRFFNGIKIGHLLS